MAENQSSTESKPSLEPNRRRPRRSPPVCLNAEISKRDQEETEAMHKLWQCLEFANGAQSNKKPKVSQCLRKVFSLFKRFSEKDKRQFVEMLYSCAVYNHSYSYAKFPENHADPSQMVGCVVMASLERQLLGFEETYLQNPLSAPTRCTAILCQLTAKLRKKEREIENRNPRKRELQADLRRLRLQEVDGLKSNQIAIAEDISRETLKKSLQRAKRHRKQMWLKRIQRDYSPGSQWYYWLCRIDSISDGAQTE